MSWASVASCTASQPFRLSSPVKKQEEPRRRGGDSKYSYPNSHPARVIGRMCAKSEAELSRLRANNTLDLHMVFSDEAAAKVRASLQSWWAQEMQCRERGSGKMNAQHATYAGSFTIITGAGNHSINNICVMKKITKQILDKGRYMYRETQASFVVLGKKTL